MTSDAETLRAIILKHFNPTDHGWKLRPTDAAEEILDSDWLAEHDARVRAEAWDEGATAASRGTPGERWRDNPYREGIHDAEEAL